MPVELKKQRDGKLRKTWYGRYEINGKRYCTNLDIPIKGTPPPKLSLRKAGDAAFEVTRGLAIAKLESIVEEVRSKEGAVRLVEKLYAIKTGETLETVKPADLPMEWARIPRNGKPQERYAEECQQKLQRFVDWLAENHPHVRDIGQLTRSIARDYLGYVGDQEVAPRTWNGVLKLLRSTFGHLLPPGTINPFSNMPSRSLETVYRKPFTPDQLKAILEVAEHDDFIRPILVTGMCTAMRRADCCLLDWRDVDLEKRFITVKTAKTGQTVSIPIFALLLEVLNTQKQRAEEAKIRLRQDSASPCPSAQGEAGVPVGYVFPEQAAHFLRRPDNISLRVKRVIARALAKMKPGAEAVLSPEEVRKRGHKYIASLGESDKKTKMLSVFDSYMDGKTTEAAAAVVGVANGTVSGYLKEIATKAECQVVRTSPTAGLRLDPELSAKRKVGQRRASLRDFHSFRVTWVTLALTDGVPLELVQKVTGHRTIDVVLTHYFQPGREDFRVALENAMPELLTKSREVPKAVGKSEGPEDKIQKLVSGMTAEDKLRLRELLKAEEDVAAEPNSVQSAPGM